MHANETHPKTGTSKVFQYGWKLDDAPGELKWLKKLDLSVDYAYQRNATRARVLNIAKNWKWIACGVITVAKRDDDHRFYVVEGQHRVLAALKRDDIDMLPCIVFKTDGPIQEAAGFYDANTMRRMPTSMEKWRAQLMRGDKTTMFVDSLLKQYGRVAGLTSGPKEVRCLTSLLNHADANREQMTRLWPLVIQVCEGLALHERVFEGLMFIECRLPADESLTDKKWRERVLKVGFGGLLDAAQRAASFYARGGSKVWGLGMLEALNKGYRTDITLRNGA